MKNTKILKLIEGQFSPDDAREIVRNVFLSKIQFHQNKNFSSNERFGKEDSTAVQRIPELIESLDTLLRIIEEAQKNKEILQIIAEVKINRSKS